MSIYNKKKVLKKMRRFRTKFRHELYRMHGFLHDSVTVRTNQGLMTIPTRDKGVAASLFQERQHEYDSSLNAVNFLKETGFIAQGDLCMLDVGANIGHISIGLLLANQIQQTIAVEPEPGNFGFLQQNVKQNGLSKRMLGLQLAVGDRETILEMEIAPLNRADHRIRSKPSSSVTEQNGESSRNIIEVQSLPLDRIVKLPEIQQAGISSPSFMWIDVQGFEGYAFKGGASVLDGGLPTVAEIWPYGILRAGMDLAYFTEIVSTFWSDYWIERRERFIRYPISTFDRYLDELGSDGYFENVIFTKS